MDWVWTPTTAEKVRPGDVVRGVVREPGDPDLTARIVDRFNGQVYIYFDGQPDAIVFTRKAPLELRVDLDGWLSQEDALHEERISQGGY